MDFLKKPELDASTVQIFQKCVAGYVGTPNDEESIANATAKRTRLAEYEKAVAESARRYDDCIPNQEFKEPTLSTALSTKERRKELQKVYEEKFSPEKQPGRPYYELIRRTKECGRCPICGGAGGITHLDHYLPKSAYPTLCVHPNNLIPICDSCNTVKNTKENELADGMPIHLYFDRLPQKKRLRGNCYTEAYLFVDLDDDFQPEFRVECPDDWSSGLESRLVAHMKMYDLYRRYRACVYSEYAAIISAWDSTIDEYASKLADKMNKPLDDFIAELSEGKVEQLKIDALSDVIESNRTAASGDLNSWKSALYRALQNKEKKLAAWLDENEENVLNVAKKYESALRKQVEELEDTQ